MIATPAVNKGKSIAEHIHDFENRDIILELEGTKLRVVAPLGLLSDAEREFIGTNRDLIIRYLKGEHETFTV